MGLLILKGLKLVAVMFSWVLGRYLLLLDEHKQVGVFCMLSPPLWYPLTYTPPKLQIHALLMFVEMYNTIFCKGLKVVLLFQQERMERELEIKKMQAELMAQAKESES